MITVSSTSTDHAVSAYAFTPEDKQRLASVLAQAYLQAKAQAYQRALATTAHIVYIRTPWQVDASEVEKAQQWATTQVESIVETYETLLRHAIEEIAQERALSDVIGKAKEKAKQIAEWFLLFLPWKTKQIADHTWSTGDNAGTQQFISDVQDKRSAHVEQSKKNVHEVVSDGKSLLKVMVLPAHSSSDECAEIAGVTFSLDKAPSPPMHIGCIHYLEMVIVDE